MSSACIQGIRAPVEMPAAQASATTMVSFVSIWTHSRPNMIRAVRNISLRRFLLTEHTGIVYVHSMSQRNNHCRTTEMNRLATASGLLHAGGMLLVSLVLVLLITNGGAG